MTAHVSRDVEVMGQRLIHVRTDHVVVLGGGVVVVVVVVVVVIVVIVSVVPPRLPSLTMDWPGITWFTIQTPHARWFPLRQVESSVCQIPSNAAITINHYPQQSMGLAYLPTLTSTLTSTIHLKTSLMSLMH